MKKRFAAAWIRYFSVVIAAGGISGTAAGKGATAAPGTGDAMLEQMAALQGRFTAIARDAGPSVVSITAATQTVAAPEAAWNAQMTPEKLSSFTAKVRRTSGSGFFIQSDGYILTNQHVIAEGRQIWITTDDRRVYPAMVVGSDPRVDLAVLKIPATGMPAVHFADRPAERGDWSFTMGNPYGLATEGEMSVSVGVVSAMHRALPELSLATHRLYSDLIQTTAQINPGNSGGPLLNLKGEVIGIVTAAEPPDGLSSGIGFAIPATGEIRSLIQALQEGNRITHGYLGTRCEDPTPQQCRDNKLERITGAWVDRVDSGSPAAGQLAAGDLVTQINEQTILDANQFAFIIETAPPGQALRIRFSRGGEAHLVTLTPARNPEPEAVNAQTEQLCWMGAIFTPAGDGGVRIAALEPGSPLVRWGWAAGSVIKSFAGQEKPTLMDMLKIAGDSLPTSDFLAGPASPQEVRPAGKQPLASAQSPQ